MLCGWYQIALPNPLQSNTSALRPMTGIYTTPSLTVTVKISECKDVALE